MNTLHIARIWAQVLLENEHFKQSYSVSSNRGTEETLIFVIFPFLGEAQYQYRFNKVLT